MSKRTHWVVLLSMASATAAAMPAAQASVQASPMSCAKPDGRVNASTTRAGTLYIGGSFARVVDPDGHSFPRAGLAAINMRTCNVLPWRADTNGDVFALRAVGRTVYVGGAFTRINGRARTRLAALAASDASLRAFTHKVDQPIRALTSDRKKLYAGGSFTRVDGAPRAKLAAFGLRSGSLSSAWRPNASGAVLTLARSPGGRRIYVGGLFTAINHNTRYSYLGAVRPRSGALISRFTPHAAFPILSVAANRRGIYAGGDGHGGHLALWNRNGSLQRPIYQTDGGVQAVRVHGKSLYAGGHFVNYCLGNTGHGSPFHCDNPLPRHKLFEVNLSTGRVTDWAPQLNSPLGVFCESIRRSTGDLWVGGDFTTVNSLRQPHLAVFPG